MKVVNFGSLNIDHVYAVDHFCRAGETIHTKSYAQNAGGKGLNQSIAVARSGQTLCHAGMLGAGGEPLAQLRMPCARSGHVGVLEAALPEQPCALTLTCRLVCEGETLEEHALPVYVGALGPLEAAFG